MDTQTTTPDQLPVNKYAQTYRAGLVAVVVVLALVGIVLYTRMQDQKRDFLDAKKAATKAMVQVSKRDAPAVRALGNDVFQSLYTDEQLQQKLDAIKQNITGTPTVTHQGFRHDQELKSVDTIYRYDSGKNPYYIRITESYTGVAGWRLTNISGSKTETPLLK